MDHLFENDVKFLITQTGLNSDNLISLIETPKDFNLVVDAVSKRDISRKDAYNLSLSTFCKLLIFKYSEKFSYPIEEKLYIANILYKNFPRLQARINFGYLSNGETSEKLSQYYLVLMGFFYKRLKDNFFTPEIWKKVETGFRNGSCPESGAHLQNWVSILHAIERDDWFLTSKTKGLTICQPKGLVITR